MKRLFNNTDEWTFPLIEKTWDAINKIGKKTLGFDYYEPQIEIISSEQMLDAYSSVAMPIMYEHWSFGKSFTQNAEAYKKGRMGLAYEVVINTDPCLVYCMENNSMTMQALVLAHAGVGHSSFFKNNYLFQEFTDAGAILPYLRYAKNYIEECERKYGKQDVERVLDAAHSIREYGIDKYKRPASLRKEERRIRELEKAELLRVSFNDIDRTLPTNDETYPVASDSDDRVRRQYDRDFPEENLLRFLEKASPVLTDWQREVLRIVRKVAQYFYPQQQTSLMNEGWATFTHYQIMTEMWTKGLISEGSYLEFLQSHTGVVYQPPYSEWNVYALGFAMMMDIKRICENPDDEDKYWNPDICNTDWKTTMKNIVSLYRDESFVLQFLGPKVIRHFKMFSLHDKKSDNFLTVNHIHLEEDVLAIRQAVSESFSLSHRIPHVEVQYADWYGQQVLMLNSFVSKGRTLDGTSDASRNVVSAIQRLWGGEILIN